VRRAVPVFVGGRESGGDNARVERTLHWWIVRAVVLVVVAVSTFTLPYGPTRNLVSEIVAIVVAVLALALCTASERSPAARARLAGVLPFAAAAMAVTSGLASLTSSGGPFILLATMATMWAGDEWSLAVAGTITGVAVAVVASVAGGFRVSAWDELGYPVVLCAGLLLGRLLRGYRTQVEQSAELLAKAEELRKEQGRVATLDERNRIAREIHDVLAHSLGALGVQIQAAQAVLTDQRDVERAVELLGQARRMASEGLQETRRALGALRNDTPPLPEGLADLSAAHERRYRAPVRLEVRGTPRLLSADAGLALTRTAQEALVNSAKHAPHQPVEVRLDFGDSRTALTVTNQLCECDHDGDHTLETADGGYGLTGMRERLRLLDGSLDAGPENGSWIVSADVPQ
jgi:signal transduction histidine kinase